MMRHPVVSRAFYAKHGLFDPAYRGVYCDHDLTLRAFWDEVILDGRSLVWQHRHPSADGYVVPSESHELVNSDEEYRYGRGVYRASWAGWRRRARIRLLSSADYSTGGEVHLRRVHNRNVLRETLASPLRAVQTPTRRGGRFLREFDPLRLWRSGSESVRD